MSEIFKRLALSGDAWVLYVLLLASVASVGVMIERWRVFARNRGDLSALMDGLANSLEKRDVAAAIQLASSSPRVEARVALAGLRSFSNGAPSVEGGLASPWRQEKTG